MKEELTAFQPELIKKSAETDKVMAQVKKETVEVDAKKELVSADEKAANTAAAAAKAIKVSHSSNNTVCQLHCSNPSSNSV